MDRVVKGLLGNSGKLPLVRFGDRLNVRNKGGRTVRRDNSGNLVMVPFTEITQGGNMESEYKTLKILSNT